MLCAGLETIVVFRVGEVGRDTGSASSTAGARIDFGLARFFGWGTYAGCSSSSSSHFERFLDGVDGPDSADIEENGQEMCDPGQTTTNKAHVRHNRQIHLKCTKRNLEYLFVTSETFPYKMLNLIHFYIPGGRTLCSIHLSR